MNLASAHLITAMVTPFDDQQHIDFHRLEQLIEHLLATGTDGLLVGGTTGEGPTLSIAEKRDLYTQTAKIVAGRVPIIANTGTNDTAATIHFTHIVSQIEGIDAALVVVPPYNKPNQTGMMAHFTAIAEKSDLPIIIYNIPGRVGVKMTVTTILTLAHNPNIIGIKQCGSDEELAAIVEKAPKDFLVYTGEDAPHLEPRRYHPSRANSTTFNAEDGSTIHTTLTGTRQSGAERPTLVSRKHAPTNFTVNHQ